MYPPLRSYTKPKTEITKPPTLNLPTVRETASSPTMHSLSPSSALGPANCRSRSWPKEQTSKSIAQAGRLQSKDLLDTEWVDFQGRSRSWSKEDSGPSLEEDEKLKSKDLLDTEWIDFQHNIQDPPEAPKRVWIKIREF